MHFQLRYPGMAESMDYGRRKWLRCAFGGIGIATAGRLFWPSPADAAITKTRPSRSVLEWLSEAQRRDVLSNRGQLDLREALREAILWCARERVQLDWPAGTYSTTHLGKGTKENALLLPNGAEVVWRGTGRRTRIVRRENSFGPGNFSVMFPLAAMPNSTVTLIDIEGFEADGNYRGNADAIRASGWNGEQAAFFKVQTRDPATGTVLYARFDRLHSVDPVADTISLGPSNQVRAWLQEAHVTNYTCENRNHLRADIVMGSGAAFVRVEGFRALDNGSRASRIESEFSAIPTDGPVPICELRDIVVGQLEVGGRNRLRVKAEEVETTHYAILTQAAVDFRNCKLRIGDFSTRTWTCPSGIIRDSTIRMPVKRGQLYNLNINAVRGIPQDLTFERVHFDLDGDPVSEKPVAAIRLPPVPSTDKRLSLRDCSFDPRFSYTLHAVGYPLVQSEGNVLAGSSGYCMMLGMHPGRPGPTRLISHGDHLPDGAVLYQTSENQRAGMQFMAEVY